MKRKHKKADRYLYHYDKVGQKLAWLKTQIALCDYTEYYAYPDRRAKSMRYKYWYEKYDAQRLELRKIIEKLQRGCLVCRFIRRLRRK